MNFLLPVVVTAFLLCVTSVRSEVLPTPPLQTMTKDDLLKIYDCIVQSPFPLLCNGFETCNAKKPDQILKAFKECGEKLGDASKRSCSGDAHLYTHDLNSQIYDCTAEKLTPLNELEKEQLKNFEICVKGLNACAFATPGVQLQTTSFIFSS